MSLKVKCRADREIYKNEDFRIVSFSPLQTYDELKLSKYFTFSCKGSNFPYINIGKNYEIEIEELSTDKYGTAYSILSCPSIDSIDLKNLKREEKFEILMDCTSSERIANNILDAYPDFIEIILTDGKEAIDTSKIKGVGQEYLKAYSRELLEKYKYYHILKKYNMYKVDVSDCKLLVDIYKDEHGINKAMRANPYYVMIEILGRGFEYADKMIIDYRKDLVESNERCEALIISVLRRNEMDGSTRLSGADLYYYIKEEYDVPYFIPLLKDVSVESDYIYYDEKSKDLSVMDTYLAECKVADFVKDKLENSSKLDIDWSKYKEVDGFELTDMQLNSLKNFCESNISILAGYSGSGKSASVKNLVRMMEDNHLSYLLLSSTGKASKVLSESTGRKAYTVHKKCYEGELCPDAIIVDECGMLALDTFIMLLNAVENPNCRFVFVGDPAQLSSIGLSKIFDDFINSNIIPTTMLTEIFRYKSDGSLFVATNIRNGKNFLNDSNMVKYENGEYSVGKNYRFIECDSDDILDRVVDEYTKLLNKGIKQKDIMVLSPFNVKSTGTYAINNSIQAEINPIKPNEKYLERKIGEHIIVFKVNDVVLNTKNDYRAMSIDAYKKMKASDGLLKEEDVADSLIVNGQTGVIREVLNDGLIVQYEEDLIYVSKAKLRNLLLGSSLSTHKCQGSSVDYTISIVSNQHKKMLTRGLLYVADTRCRKAHIDIGDIDAFEDALKVVDNDLRRTWLKELLTTD